LTAIFQKNLAQPVPFVQDGNLLEQNGTGFLPALYAFQINCIRTLEESQKPTQTRQHQQLAFSLLHQVLDS